MNKWLDKLSDKSIFYITPDVKRGIGPETLPNYHIICTFSDPIIPILREQGVNIFCLEESIGPRASEFNNSGRLIEQDEVNTYIRKYAKKDVNILIFKPSEKIELICKAKGYNLLANPKQLNDKYENKVDFFNLMTKEKFAFTIPGISGILGKFDFTRLKEQLGLPFVVQFSHGWAGRTTYFIKRESDFLKLLMTFPNTRVKINKFIEGFTVLNNACIYGEEILISPAAMQISNINVLQEKYGATCGRQWPARFISKDQEGKIEEITGIIGKIMHNDGYRGYFGLDFIIEKNSGKVFLSENNARFTASSAFFTKLEQGLESIPLLFYHLAEFLKVNLSVSNFNPVGICGSQIIFRNSNVQPHVERSIDYGVFDTEDISHIKRNDYQPDKLEKNEFIFMRRNRNISKGEDFELSRIEYKGEVLEDENKFKDWVNKLLI